MAKLSGQSCGDFQLGGYLSNQTTAIWTPLEHLSMSDGPEKQASGKEDQGTIGNGTHMDLLVHWCRNLVGGKKSALPLCVWKLAIVKSSYIFSSQMVIDKMFQAVKYVCF